MPSNLKTEYLTIGRSGKTVDGRAISTQMIQDAAETYDPGVFTAMIWPEHDRWYNMGFVDSVKAIKNDEGGMDLQAILRPNDFYLAANSIGQRIFTSMELTRDFRGSGKYYLTGLGATDQPASAGVSAVRFSQETGETFRSESVPVSLFTQPEPASLFSRLLGNHRKEDADMANAELLKTFTDAFAAIKAEIDALKLAIKPAGGDADPPVSAEAFARLQAEVQALGEKLTAVQPPADLHAKLDALGADLAALEEKFTRALAEAAPGTPPPPDAGGAPSSRHYL